MEPLYPPTTTTIDPAELRGAPLFWHVMDTFIRPQANNSHLDPDNTWAAAKPGEPVWDQACWRNFVGDNECGTAFCLAGYICEVTDGRWVVTHDENGKTFLNGKRYPVHTSFPIEMLHAEGDDLDEDIDLWGDISVIPAQLRIITARRRALRLLGLNDDYNLFCGSNTYDDLVHLGQAMFGPRLVSTAPEGASQ